jgi:hypothetical protein
VAYGVGVLVVIGAWWGSGVGLGERRAEVDALRARVQEKWERNEEAQGLVEEIEAISATIMRYNRLAWPVRVSRVIDTIAGEMPGSATLTTLTFTPREDTVRPPSGARGKDAEPRVERYLLVELEGVAPGDGAVARVVSGIERHPLFERVVLDFARSVEIDGVEARSFRATCRVDLDERYRFADASGGGS